MIFEHESMARAERHATAIGGSFIVATVSFGDRGVRLGSDGQQCSADKVVVSGVDRLKHR